MTGLPAMQLYRDVPVVPVLRARRSVAQGGPIWPDFDAQVAARHCRNGLPSDSLPSQPARLRPISRHAVWGGYLIRQFGHLVAEHLTRLPQSVRDRPDDLYLFTVERGDDAASLPGYIWDVLGWYGVRRDRVRIITQPCLVARLRVAAQGEMLGGVPTSPEYLDLLETTAARNRLQPEPNRLVFVTRAGLAAKGLGGHAGEGYLADLLARLGVRVLDPGRVPIRDQLALYSGAGVLVFSEGSALHGRGMLGRLPQDIHVLRRRSWRNTARTQLAPRCVRLVYHQTLSGRLGTGTETRGSRVDLELAFYDVEALFAAFLACGIDLRPLWDQAAYRAAVAADLAGWSAANPTTPAQAAANLAVLAGLGFAPLGFATDAFAAPLHAAASVSKG